jgi:hypothetical protein
LEEAAEIVETSESNTFRTVVDAMPTAVLAEYGFSWQEVDGATAIFFEKLPIPAFNRVIGLGLHQAATEAMIDDLISLYDPTGIPFGISVSPASQPKTLAGWLLDRGFQHTSNWAKMIRGTDPPPEIETALRIEQVDEVTAADYAAVGQVAFKLPAGGWRTPCCQPAG